MKKLFALVLCVMMLVSVLPTMAFAARPDTYETAVQAGEFQDAKIYTNLIKDTLDGTKDSIEDAYKAVVGNEVVYNTAVAMDDTLMGMFDKMWDMFTDADLDVEGTTTVATEDGQKAYLRAAFGALVAGEMPTAAEWKDDDPVERAQDFAKAVSKAFASEKFQKGYQALATYIALSNLVDDVNDEIEDRYEDFFDYTVDSDFVSDFQSYGTSLQSYFNTVEASVAGTADGYPWGLWLAAQVES